MSSCGLEVLLVVCLAVAVMVTAIGRRLLLALGGLEPGWLLIRLGLGNEWKPTDKGFEEV